MPIDPGSARHPAAMLSIVSIRVGMVGASMISDTYRFAPERPGNTAGAMTPTTRALPSAAPREAASMVPP